jgi:BirA family biotin operon repressor/biotin-[acetyl-CoA-carboxylase] ligase
MTPRFYHFSAIDSTNTFAKHLLESQGCAAHGSVVIADEQTAGRGRVGRDFFSPATGLYMSLVFCPASGEEVIPARFTVTAAVGVCVAVEELFGMKCGIKWVNDILVEQGGTRRKVCGILAESVVGSGIVVGIGVNIAEPPEGWAPEIAAVAGSLLGKNSSEKPQEMRDKLAAAICERAFRYFAGGETLWPEVLQEYRRRSVLIGQKIRVYPVAGIRDKAYIAKAIRVTDDAALVVQTETGEERTLQAGEVSTESL